MSGTKSFANLFVVFPQFALFVILVLVPASTGLVQNLGLFLSFQLVWNPSLKKDSEQVGMTDTEWLRTNRNDS